MNRYELIKTLIERVEKYENEQIDKNNLSLSGYLNSFSSEENASNYKNSFVTDYEIPEEDKGNHRENSIERVISQHLLFLSRYIKYYSKHVFENSRIKTLEEFSMLIMVMQHTSISKSELIKRNIFDKSSGIEMINRLIKTGLLTQESNPNDLRGQLINLTMMGKITLFESFEKMEMLGNIATGELSKSEKYEFARMLKKLDHFHYDNYTKKGNKELTDYLPKSESN